MVSLRMFGLFALVTAVLCVVVPPAAAQTASLGAFINGQPACDVAISSGQVLVVEIRLTASLAPIKTAHFKVVPSVPMASQGPVDGEFDVTLAGCATAGSSLALFVCQTTGSAAHCDFNLVPATGQTDIELTDCDGFAMTGRDALGWIDPCDDVSLFLGAYRPSPADGATGVPLNTPLNFVGYGNVIALATHPFQYPYQADRIVCATQPYPYYNAPPCAFPQDPGPLLPNTTYYWKVEMICWGCNHGEGALSGLFSFTTAGPLAVKPATWGHIKAMYRE